MVVRIREHEKYIKERQDCKGFSTYCMENNSNGIMQTCNKTHKFV